jgi:Ion channel
MVSPRSHWLRLVDRLSGPWLTFIGLALTVSFTLIYWVLTKNLPEQGIRGPEGEGELDLLTALYFSVVTESTLGYGDFRPIGASRVFVCLQVLLGLMFAGLVVAKITSAQGRRVRLVSYKASGEWIEVCTMQSNNKPLFTHAVIFYDGDMLRYDGENFDSEGEPKGFFYSKLIDGEGGLCRFTYTNKDSTGNYFEDGLANLLFQGQDATGRWNRYQGTAFDFGTKETTVYEGIRASDGEMAILGGSNFDARMQLVKGYIASHVQQNKGANKDGAG